MSRQKERAYRTLLYMILAGALVALAGAIYYSYWSRIPSTIKVRAGVEQSLDFQVPVSGEIYRVHDEESVQEATSLSDAMGAAPAVRKESGYSTEAASQSVHVDFSHPVKVRASQIDNYQMDLKLFGMLPYKSVDVQVIQDKMLTPSGMPIGIYVKTEGVLVVGIGQFEGEDGKEVSPARYALQKGDYILKANGERIENKKQFIDRIEQSGGEDLILTIRRSGEVTDVQLNAQKNYNREWKLGIWIRDNAQGVGTMTYMDENGNFGALGHGINDVDTSTLMNTNDGTLYRTEIVSIKKGRSGEPGEMTGMIIYTPDRILGDITSNSEKGIFGTCNEKALGLTDEDPIPIGLKTEIEKGPAQILCAVNGTPAYYDVEITAVHMNQDNINRGIELKVTDKQLLKLTGGIVQGMSGSPIVQNGKLIGAVTHVFVNDPAKGYGIFIENMLSH